MLTHGFEGVMYARTCISWSSVTARDGSEALLLARWRGITGPQRVAGSIMPVFATCSTVVSFW